MIFNIVYIYIYVVSTCCISHRPIIIPTAVHSRNVTMTPCQLRQEDFAPRIRLRGKNMGGSAGSKRARATRATKGASSDNEEFRGVKVKVRGCDFI